MCLFVHIFVFCIFIFIFCYRLESNRKLSNAHYSLFRTLSHSRLNPKNVCNIQYVKWNQTVNQLDFIPPQKFNIYLPSFFEFNFLCEKSEKKKTKAIPSQVDTHAHTLPLECKHTHKPYNRCTKSWKSSWRVLCVLDGGLTWQTVHDKNASFYSFRFLLIFEWRLKT